MRSRERAVNESYFSGRIDSAAGHGERLGDEKGEGASFVSASRDGVHWLSAEATGWGGAVSIGPACVGPRALGQV